MHQYELQILETLLIFIIYIIAFLVTRKVVNRSLKKAQLNRARRKFIVKLINILVTIIVVVFLAGIWGLDQNEIAVFASTVLTVLGIAFFAQWSLLSNITSSLLLFFNHPLKLGDTIKLLDKDYEIEGEISELTYFFVHIKTKEGQIVTIPNSQIFQKSVAIIEKGE